MKFGDLGYGDAFKLVNSNTADRGYLSKELYVKIFPLNYMFSSYLDGVKYNAIHNTSLFFFDDDTEVVLYLQIDKNWSDNRFEDLCCGDIFYTQDHPYLLKACNAIAGFNSSVYNAIDIKGNVTYVHPQEEVCRFNKKEEHE